MSTIKTGTTLTTAYQVVGDTTGTLVLQTGATPTTAMTIDSSQNTTVAGNLTLSGVAARITGDFSNSTVANRVMFQTSTVNSQTSVSVTPNGTSTSSSVLAFNNSDPANSAYVGILNTGTEARLGSGIIGTGSYLPMTFYTGGSERVRVDTSGNVGIGTSSPSKKLEVGSLGAFRLQTGSVTMDCTPTAGATDGFVWNTSAASYYDWAYAGSVKMRIDSSGNVGIGTTTPSSYGGKLAVIGGTTRTSAFAVGGGDYGTGRGYIYLNGGGYDQSVIYDAWAGSATTPEQAAGKHIFSTGGTERARIDSSGNLCIGNTGGGYRLDVTAGDTTAGFGYAARLRSNATAGAATLQFTNNAVTVENGYIRVTDAGLMSFSNKAYIDSSGNLLVGTTSNSIGFRFVVGSATSFGVYSPYWNHFCSSGNEFNFTAAYSGSADVYFNYRSGSANNGANAYITQYRFWNGNAGSGTYVGITAGAYTNGSDYRLKSNIELLSNGSLDKILSLTPRTFIFRGEDKTTIGFVAHEVQEFIPEAVSGVKDGVDADGDPEYQGIDYAQITTSLVKAIQELNAKVDAQAAEIAALKGQ